MTNKPNSLFHKIIITCLSIMVVISLSLTAERYYWRYWPFVPIVIDGPIKILNIGKKVCPGSTLGYEISFDKKLPLIATINRQLRNSYVYTLAESSPSLKTLGKQKVWAVLPVPRAAEYGMYRLHWTATYEIGPEKREISVQAISEEFEVVRCGEKEEGHEGRKGK